jgi:accessory colonization factor AcfC
MRKPVTLVAALLAGLILSIHAAHAETLRIYGPGGPAPAVKELAKAFAKEKGIEVVVTAGPTPAWLEQAKGDAHLIFSGSENMMSSFITAFAGQIDESTVEPLYLRPSAILVRKGNPKSIKGLRDLTKPGMKIMVTEGAGQVGMWEDAAGRSGDIGLLKGFRGNIVAFAPNSGMARKRWGEQADIDAWLIWTHWQINDSAVADMVAVEPELTIWRATDIAVTARGHETKAAAQFVAYLKSDLGEQVFKRQGWKR